MKKDKAKENLVNKFVTLYLLGGWEVSGQIKSITNEKIVLEQDGTGDLFLAFRDKVSCLHVSMQKASTKKSSDTPPAPPMSQDSQFPMNKIAYDDSGMSIPQGLLKDLPPEDDDDFSITFKKNSGEGVGGHENGGIEFRLQNDSTKED